MRTDEAWSRLESWAKGKPLPRYETLHFAMPDPADILFLSFLRMGGESSPWGICYGHAGKRPTVLTVPEARNRDLVADMVADFGAVLLEHFYHPDHSDFEIDQPRADRPTRQIWLPNASHLDMLHFLAYSYSFTKWGEPKRAKLLNQVGRLAGWLFRESQRPGQVTVMVATDVLRGAFVFPAEEVRQAHLGFLLAWLNTTGGREKRLAAAQEAERLSIATSLDPAVERDQLGTLVERWGEANRSGQAKQATAAAKALEQILGGELSRRHQLVQDAINLLRNDSRPENPGVAVLENAGREEHWYQYLRLEKRLDDKEDGPAFTPSPETDLNPRAAAARYFVQEASEALRLGALIHHDRDLQREAVQTGDGRSGTIVAVRDDGTGRAMVPVWTIRADDPGAMRIREGTRLCVAGIPQRKVAVTDMTREDASHLRVEVEVTGWKRANVTDQGRNVPAATDARLNGKAVVLLPDSDEWISRKKSMRVWADGVPGGWLTHARPAGRKAVLDPEVAEQSTENLYLRAARR